MRYTLSSCTPLPYTALPTAGLALASALPRRRSLRGHPCQVTAVRSLVALGASWSRAATPHLHPRTPERALGPHRAAAHASEYALRATARSGPFASARVLLLRSHAYAACICAVLAPALPCHSCAPMLQRPLCSATHALLYPCARITSLHSYPRHFRAAALLPLRCAPAPAPALGSRTPPFAPTPRSRSHPSRRQLPHPPCTARPRSCAPRQLPARSASSRSARGARCPALQRQLRPSLCTAPRACPDLAPRSSSRSRAPGPRCPSAPPSRSRAPHLRPRRAAPARPPLLRWLSRASSARRQLACCTRALVHSRAEPLTSPCALLPRAACPEQECPRAPSPTALGGEREGKEPVWRPEKEDGVGRG
jgi:hypothetical protein